MPELLPEAVMQEKVDIPSKREETAGRQEYLRSLYLFVTFLAFCDTKNIKLP